MKKFIFLLIVFFCPLVFAQDVDVTSNCYGSTGYASMYSGDEVQYQTYSNYNFGTLYQYQLSSFETELRYQLLADTNYTITINTNGGNDFRNNFRTWSVYDLDNNSNDLVTGFTFISMKKIQITFQTTTATNNVKIQFGGANSYDNITGNTNWNLKNVILTVPDNAPTGSTNQDIINNQTDNTNSIINNNNSNTSNIIDNANQNTQSIIDNQKVCTIYDNTRVVVSNKYLSDTGQEVVTDGLYGITGYINIQHATITKLINGMNNGGWYCYYTSNKSLISCHTVDTSLNIPSNAVYFRSTIDLSRNIPQFEVCQNGNQALSGAISDIGQQAAQNAQDIINNQNQNAQATQEAINNNFNNCDPKLVFSLVRSDASINSSYLASNGQVAGSGSNVGISDYISISSNTDYSIRQSSVAINLGSFCLYTTSKSLINCTTFSNNLTRDFNSGSASYLRTTLSSSATISLYNLSCSNRIDDVNDTLTDDSVDDKSSFFSGFTSDDHGLSSIITIPLNTIQQLTNSSCVPLSVPIPFTNSNVNLPCMTQVYETHISTIYNIWQVVSFGIIAYFICIDIFRMVKGFKDPQEDKVEVLDL